LQAIPNIPLAYNIDQKSAAILCLHECLKWIIENPDSLVNICITKFKVFIFFKMQRIVICVPADNISTIYTTELRNLELDFDNITTQEPRTSQIVEMFGEMKAVNGNVKQDADSFYRYSFNLDCDLLKMT